jgi:DNA-directed RNA polymerase specialized sigma24 family protein
MTGVDRETFAALYRDHVNRVTGFAVRRLSNPGEVADLVAATFLAALERSDSYDPAKGDPSAWLLGIAANLLANQRRRAVREQLARTRASRHSRSPPALEPRTTRSTSASPGQAPSQPTRQSARCQTNRGTSPHDGQVSTLERRLLIGEMTPRPHHLRAHRPSLSRSPSTVTPCLRRSADWPPGPRYS